MANKSLGTRQKLMFRGTTGTRQAGGRPPLPAPPGGARSIGPGRTGAKVGAGGGSGAVDPNTGRKQRGTKTGGA